LGEVKEEKIKRSLHISNRQKAVFCYFGLIKDNKNELRDKFFWFSLSQRKNKHIFVKN
jgi:hypothetical protein